VVFDGQRIERLPAHRRNQLGIAWVPQEREVFKSLTVAENLQVVARPGDWTLDRVLGLFPRLGQRLRNLGSQLSGGEQQMLAMARALMTNPRLLLLDEPVEGLAPLVVQEMLRAIDAMRSDGGMSVLLVEQKWDLALAHSDRCVVIDHGSVVHQDRSELLLDQPDLIDRLLGVAA
jgi:branched-chain amino acid transport system ATP-binding protein